MDSPKTYIETISIESPKILDLADGTIKTEDGYSFTIHKIALAKSSKYFFTLFCGPGKGKREYMIPGIRGEVLSNILTYLYTEKIYVNERNIFDVIEASDYLLLESLLSQMKALLEKNISINNCLDLYQLMMQIGRDNFMKVSYRFMQLQFQEIVCNTKTNFCEWPVEILKQLLNDRNIRLEHEKIVWQAILRWTESDPLNRLCHVPDLLMYLRINEVDEKLATEILTHKIVKENTFFRPITFSSAAKYRDLLKFHQLNYCTDTQEFSFQIPRKPLNLNFIANIYHWTSFGKFVLYVTYDENVDLWRRLFEVDWHPKYLVSLGDCLYLFKTANELHRYNIPERKWINFSDLRHPRLRFALASLGGFIYTIGGHLGYNFNTRRSHYVYDVEVYNVVEDSWHDTTPLLPTLNLPDAVTLNGYIYVVGPNTTETGMSFQMYDPSTELWNALPVPSFYRTFYAFVSYKEKLFLIGGLSTYYGPDEDLVKHVEVFDPLQNIWYSIESLPHTYIFPRAVVIEDVLIVSEDPGACFSREDYNPPVQWNVHRDSWESIEESSPFFKIDDYFFAIEGGDGVDSISRENKKITTVFEKSPFF